MLWTWSNRLAIEMPNWKPGSLVMTRLLCMWHMLLWARLASSRPRGLILWTHYRYATNIVLVASVTRLLKLLRFVVLLRTRPLVRHVAGSLNCRDAVWSVCRPIRRLLLTRLYRASGTLPLNIDTISEPVLAYMRDVAERFLQLGLVNKCSECLARCRLRWALLLGWVKISRFLTVLCVFVDYARQTSRLVIVVGARTMWRWLGASLVCPLRRVSRRARRCAIVVRLVCRAPSFY